MFRDIKVNGIYTEREGSHLEFCCRHQFPVHVIPTFFTQRASGIEKTLRDIPFLGIPTPRKGTKIRPSSPKFARSFSLQLRLQSLAKLTRHHTDQFFHVREWCLVPKWIRELTRWKYSVRTNFKPYRPKWTVYEQNNDIYGTKSASVRIQSSRPFGDDYHSRRKGQYVTFLSKCFMVCRQDKIDSTRSNSRELSDLLTESGGHDKT